jgi:hypothetical protein
MLTSQVLRVLGLSFAALVLWTIATFPTRMRLARDHYKMWREERQLARERAHVAAAIERAKAGGAEHGDD